MIAHRLSTFRHAHRIHLLAAGRIVDASTHEEMVGQGGPYAALWRVQTGEAAVGSPDYRAFTERLHKCRQAKHPVSHDTIPIRCVMHTVLMTKQLSIRS